ncbi:hypothetical protein ACHAW6_013466 [Cyclotella cf. meneghiniana]
MLLHHASHASCLVDFCLRICTIGPCFSCPAHAIQHPTPAGTNIAMPRTTSNATSLWDSCTAHQPASPSSSDGAFPMFLPSLLLAVSSLVACVRLRRWWTKCALEEQLPTVLWTPRFVNYDPQRDDSIDACHGCLDSNTDNPPAQRQHVKKQKMGSSSITNILPKMERLGGPYGMYATVYGVSTKVVHVGHPVPAGAILAGTQVSKASFSENVIETKLKDSRNNLLYCTLKSVMLWSRAVIFRLLSFLASPYKSNSKHASHRNGLSRRSSSLLAYTTGSTKNPAYDHFKNFSGDGVFTANGMDWKAKRASVLHCLVGQINDAKLAMEVNRAADTFLEGELKIIMKLDREQERRDARDVVPMLQRCTIGLIYRLITHDVVSFNPFQDGEANGESKHHIDASRGIATMSSLRSSDTSLAANHTASAGKSQNGIHQEKKPHSKRIESLLPNYLQAVTKIRMIILAQSRSIWYLLPRWMYRLFSPMYREEERTMGPIRQFAQLACHNAREGSPLDLLSKRASHSTKDGQNGVSKDLLDEAITLLFAGQDTSAATLSWTLHLLSLDPIRQQKLAQEVRSVSGDSNVDSAQESDFVSMSMISQMPYLDAVIKESMRLYPVAPFVVRKLTSDITIQPEFNADNENSENGATTAATAASPTYSGGTTLSSSTFACIWIYALHRNPKLWHSPDEFLPERWIDPQLRQKDSGQEEPGAYIPFAMGPRNCLGRPLAQVILRVLLARIIRKYTVVDPRYEALEARLEKNDVVDAKCLRKDMQAGFTVLPSNGLMVRFVERKQDGI